MKSHFFLAGLAIVVVTAPVMAENQPAKTALENYIAERDTRMDSVRASATAVRECVSKEANGLSSAPATPTEIAQASLYRCISKLDDYEGKQFSDAYDSAPSRNPDEQRDSAKKESRYARAQLEDGLARMAIDIVIRARLTHQ